MNVKKLGFALLGTLLVLLSMGCSPLTRNEQTYADQSTSLQPGHAVGQSFVASEKGLTGIDVLIEPGTVETILALSLYSSPQQAQAIASSRLVVKPSDGKGYRRFSFPALKESRGTDYYLEIRIEEGSGLNLFAAPGETYLDGAMYQDRSPQNLQLAFRLAYEPIALGLGLLSEVSSWAWFALLGSWLFVLPGWALLRLLLGASWNSRRWAEKAALAAGAGLALFPVLLLWLDVFHLRLGHVFAWILPAGAVAMMLWKNRAWIASPPNPRLFWKKGASAFLFALTAVLVMIFFSRFWVIRGVEVPLWGDSYQHTMIAQLIAENKGLFDSWQPYEPYQSLTVQYGFSANAAAWMWLTGMKSPQAVLVFGQLLNFFAILVLFPLAVKVARGNRWAGLISLIIAGLFSVMPGYYVNYGRYAQLMGQAILPVSLCLLWQWLEDARRSMRQAALHGLLLAALLLCYYRVAYFYAAFIPVLLLLLWFHGPLERQFHAWKWVLISLVATALVSLVFISPWIPNVSGSKLSDTVETGITTQSPLQGVIEDYRAWSNYREYVPGWLLAMSVVSLFASLFFRRLEVAGLFFWLALVSAVKAGSLVQLPGANLMQSYMVQLSLYIFASLSASWFPGRVIAFGVNRFGRVGITAILIMILGFSLYGMNIQRKILNPNTYALVTRPDLRAMAWIRANLPEEAVFLVEGFRIYNGISAVGSDGGWWIPLLAGRRNTMPPQYALLNERPEPADYSQNVVDLVESLEKLSPIDPAMRKELCQRGVTHIYVGQQQGKASMEKIQLFPAELDDSGSVVQKVYSQDRVRIYAYLPNFCLGSSSQ